MNAPQEIDFSALERAVLSLKEALRQPPKSELERDGVIQRFEYTFELCWKFIRRLLVASGRSDVSSSPRPLLRDAHQEHWITDIESWFTFLEARNNVTHAYNRKQAEQVFAAAQKFAGHAESLLGEMKRRASA